MHIMLEMYIKDGLSHQHITSSMLPSLTGVPKKNRRHLEAVPMHKQDQFNMTMRPKLGKKLLFINLLPHRTFIKTI